jgi:two-component system OmpR family sensor kinase/two-component system sensor histidine kinase QseC
MRSIRARLLIALILLVAFVSLLAATVTYRRVLNETSTLFDYQLRQMALSLRSQVSLAPRVEVPPDQGDTDFVIQIWDLFGARVYMSRPGLPLINQTVLGYADLSVRGQPGALTDCRRWTASFRSRSRFKCGSGSRARRRCGWWSRCSFSCPS